MLIWEQKEPTRALIPLRQGDSGSRLLATPTSYPTACWRDVKGAALGWCKARRETAAGKFNSRL